MASSGNRLTIIFLVVALAAIAGALVIEASRNPTFRAGDHASYRACIEAIPAAWAQGSLEWTRAEAACQFEHAPPKR